AVALGAGGAVASQLLAATTEGVGTVEAPLQRFAFGGCLVDSAGGAILDRIVAADPDLMLWQGDNIYANTHDPVELAEKYAVLGRNPRFRRLRAACPNLAVWDDHDFGLNDEGGDHPTKVESQRVFLSFWRVPRSDPRWLQEGVYFYHEVGPPGRRVQLVFLDGRYHRSDKKLGAQRRGTMLGEAQWRWLGQVLDRPADVRFILSGIQVVNTDYGGWERWGQFPHERERLFREVRERRLPGVVILSGDMHHAEISKEDGAFGYPAWDFTSCGLDQHENGEWANTRRVDRLYNAPGGKFGLVDLSWGDAPTIRVSIHDLGGDIVLAREIPLSELVPPA
ncbi:MAG: alkaline phosphatase family protein, partial [Deltaproteobacteria bacterium]